MRNTWKIKNEAGAWKTKPINSDYFWACCSSFENLFPELWKSSSATMRVTNKRHPHSRKIVLQLSFLSHKIVYAAGYSLVSGTSRWIRKRFGLTKDNPKKTVYVSVTPE